MSFFDDSQKGGASWKTTERQFQFAKPPSDLPPPDPDLAIMYALRGKMEELKEYVFIYPEVVDLKDKRNGNVAMHLAASKGNIPLINFLISRGANMNIQDSFGNSPLHYAVDKSRKETVLFLLNNGSRINLQDYKGNSPLAVACSHDDYDMVKLLLLRNADPELSDLTNIKPYDKATTLSIKNLLDSKIQMNHRGGESLEGAQSVGWMTFGVGLGVGLGMALAKRQEMMEKNKGKKKRVSMAGLDGGGSGLDGGFSGSLRSGVSGGGSHLQNAGAMVAYSPTSHQQSRPGTTNSERKFL